MSLDETDAPLKRDPDKRRDPKRKLPKIENKAGWHTGYWIAAMLALFLFQAFWSASQKIDTIAYSEFQSDLKAGKVVEVRIGPNYIQGLRKVGDSNEER